MEDKLGLVGELTVFYTNTPNPNGKRHNVQKFHNHILRPFYKRICQSLASAANQIYIRGANDGMFGVTGLNNLAVLDISYHSLVPSGEQMPLVGGGDGDEQYAEFYGTKLCSLETYFSAFFLGLKNSLSDVGGFLSGTVITSAQWDTFLDTNEDLIFAGVVRNYTVPAGKYAHVYYRVSGSGAKLQIEFEDR